MKLGYSVFRPAGRKFYVVQWTSPGTGRKRTKSTEETTKRAAERFASEWIAKLESRQGRDGDAAWASFRESHEEEVQPSLKPETRRLYGTVFNHIERVIDPGRMSDVDSRQLSRLQAKWRQAKKSEFTIRTYLTHLGKSLQWAKSQGMLADVPHIELPQLPEKGQRAKGRALATEEYERMLQAVAKVMEPVAVPSWRRLLRGLWLSGLRLQEALDLHWNAFDKLHIEWFADRPMLWIPGDQDKGAKDRLIPITPDFASLLGETPEDRRIGRVFTLIGSKGKPVRNLQYVSAKICEFGKKAGIRTRRYEATGKIKHASAHDLRRSFGRRWASRVRNATDLQVLMRHSSLETTLTYYVQEDAADLSNDLWSRFANSPANTRPEEPETSNATTTDETET